MMEQKNEQKKWNIILACLVLMVVTSLPLLTDFLVIGTRLYQQLSRVEALVEGMRQFGITMWAKPDWVDAAGLSFTFQYGDTFLYLPATLRLFGFSVQAAFRGFLLVLNVTTVLVAYDSFKRIWKDAYTGLLGAAVYSCAIYRNALLYSEAELGEVLAMLFLPMVMVGIYEMMMRPSGQTSEGEAQTMGDRNRSEKLPSWLLLTIGLSGILHAQIFSFAVVFILCLLFLLAGVKRWKEKDFLLELGKALVCFLAWNLAYLYTAFYYISSGQFFLNPYEGQRIQEKGLQVAQLFMGFYQGGPSHDFGRQGITEAAPIGLGIVMLGGILAFLYLLLIYGEKVRRQEKKLGLILLAVGLVFLYGTLLCCPWDALMRKLPTLAGVISSLQAPWHFLFVPTALFSLLICLAYQVMKRNWPEYSRYYGLGMFTAAMLCSGYLVANLLYSMDFVRSYSLEDVISYGAATGAVMAGYAGPVWYMLQGFSILSILGVLLVCWRKNRKEVRSMEGEGKA